MSAASVTKTKRILCSVPILLGTLAVSCLRGDEERGALTAVTGAPSPRPDTTTITSRTIDNAGFVDGAGHTDDEVIRSEISGMRATETGSERITGTPGYGVPIEPSPPRAPAGEMGPLPVADGMPPPPTGLAAVGDTVERVARARCDRETACNRVGAGRRWKSQDWCVARELEHARTELTHYTCAKGVDMIPLGTCLNTLRLLSCEIAGGELDARPECSESAICP